MDIIKWDDTNYSVGNLEIDKQHKRLIDTLNQLIILQKDKRDDELVSEIFNELIQYMNGHLSYEENLLEQSGYKALPEHKTKHWEYLEKVSKLTEHSGKQGVRNELITFLHGWFLNHILEEDMKYKGVL